MREWSLRAGDPLNLTLSADMLLGAPDYLDDHIWELEIGGSDPLSLCIRTTFGLRARNMRLFYRFTEGGKIMTDPAAFHESPRVRRFFPNFLSLDFVPIEGLSITAEYWVPESHVLAGRLRFFNETGFHRHIGFELCGLMSALEGKALGFSKHQMVNILGGRTGGLEPVVFLTGGPNQGGSPHPSLEVGLDFDPGTTRTLTWAVAAGASSQASFELARRITSRAWDAERARIEILNARRVVEIYTGDPEWDAALALSQTDAFRLFYPASKSLPHPSFVRSREPDGGHSRIGDSSDYPPAWSGQSALDAFYLAGIMPGSPELTRGLIENFLTVQTENGSIDGKPGLAGQRSEFLVAPVLASLAWNYYQITGDDQFLADAFPRLMAFFNRWFAPERDPDADGVPEWQHVLQTGFEANPLFDVWNPWSQSLGVQTLFNPELESMLLREAACLILMAERLGQVQELALLRQRTPVLAASISASWNRRSAGYTYRDRSTGASWAARLIGSRKGSGEIRPRRPDCGQPVRLLIQVHTRSVAATRPTVEIFGRSLSATQPNGIKSTPAQSTEEHNDQPQSERIDAAQFQWRSGGLVATTKLVYGTVERVIIEGLSSKDRAVVRTVDTASEDVTLFTPLWAHVPRLDHAQAMARRLIHDQQGFDRPFGVPALPASPSSARFGTRERAEAEALAMSVHLPWNHIIGEGLLSYGLRTDAARLTARLMSAVVHSLKKNRAFYERYHALTGAGLGERGALTGLAPVSLFLDTLGVRILSPVSVHLEGSNPFPWPVTIRYRGLTVVRETQSTYVVFPNAEPVTITDPAACVVSA